MSLANRDLVLLGEYEIDRAQWRLSWQKESIALNRKTFDLLLYLVDHPNQVVSKQELMHALWPEQFIEESNLTQHVFLLRKALSRHRSGEKIIETVPGRGYRLGAAVTNAEPAVGTLIIGAKESITRITIEEEQVEEDTGPSTVKARLPGFTQRTSGLLLIAAIGVVAVAAGWFGWQRWMDRTGGAPLQIVLAPLDGTTGDAVLDRSLLDVLRMNIAQSPFVSIVSEATVSETLTQMKRDPRGALTDVTAREVCERTNSQAFVHGSIARSGEHYLVTEEATGCVDGRTIAQGNDEANRAEDLPHAIEVLGERLRKGMGESRRSVSRFNTPLLPTDTASLEALKYYSLATSQSEQGRFPGAIALLKKAVVEDPGFAAAYYDLATDYGSTEDYRSEREALTKAQTLSGAASAPVRLEIAALYSTITTQDLYESERNYRNWTELYPRSAEAWSGLSNTQRELGRNAEAAASDKRALALRPTKQALYTNLSYMQVRAGDPVGAEATCEQAITKGLDGDHIRVNCLEAAVALKKPQLVQAQMDWMAAHPDAVFIRIDEIEFAIAEGRFADAHHLLDQCTEIFRQQGLPDVAVAVRQLEGLNMIEAGDVDEGRQLFRIKAADPENQYDVTGLALAGDFSAAETAARAMQTKYPQGTLWNSYTAPYVRALHAMALHKPQDALDALEASRSLEGREFGHTFLRANAYLAAGQPAQAEKEFRTILHDKDTDPTALEAPLSWLGLARALAAENNQPAAIDAYQEFLHLWAHADPDTLFLKQGKAELSDLQDKHAP